MTSIDKRIVQMQFDNAQFEQGVEQTLRSLEKLDDKLEFNNAEIGFGNIQRAANGVTMDNIYESVDSVDQKFSLMGVAAATVMNKLTSQAVDAGQKIAYALSLKGINDGWQEYNLKMENIQTILMNTKDKGTTIKDVEKSLDELNTYADQTTYVFSDMTRAIGQFTTAGVDLKTSVGAIKGFSNLAASVGADNSALARAEYQMSQALNSGYVKLLDWKSLENAGGMGGKVMQNALIKAGKEVQKGNKDALAAIEKIEKGNLSFRDSLSEKESPYADWLTADVLLKALNEFANDPDMIKAATQIRTFPKLIETVGEEIGSGWAKTWELIFGGYEDSVALWTEIGHFFVGNGKDVQGLVSMYTSAINGPLEEWAAGGGRKQMIDGLAAAFKAMLPVVKAIGDAFKEVFTPITGKNLLDLTEKFSNWAKALKIDDGTLESLKAGFKGVFEIIKAFGTVVGVAFKIVSIVAVPILKLFAKVLIFLFGVIGNIITILGGCMQPIVDFGNKISEATEKVKSFFRSVREGAPDLSGVGDAFKNAAKGVAAFVTGIPTEISSMLKSLGEAIQFDAWVNTFKTVAGTFREALQAALTSIGEDLKSVFSELKFGDILAALQLVVTGAGFKGVIDQLSSFKENIKPVFDQIKDVSQMGKDTAKQILPFDDIKGTLDSVKGALDGFKSTLQSYQNDLRAGVLLKIAGAVLMLAVAVKFVSSIDPDRLVASTGAIGALLAEVVAALFILNAMNFSNIKDFGKLTTSFIKVGVALAIIASALKTLAEIKDMNKLLMAATTLSTILYVMVGAMALLSMINKKAPKAGAQMMLLAISLNLVSNAIKQLADMNAKKMLIAEAGIAGILAVMTGCAVALGRFGKNVRGTGGAIAVLMLASSLSIVVSSVERLSAIKKVNRMVSSIEAIALILGELTGISILLSKFSGPRSIIGAASLVVLCTNLFIITASIEKVAALDPGKATMAVAAISTLLAAMVGILLMVTKLPPKAITAGLTIRILASSLDEIAGALGALAIIAGTGNLIPSVLALSSALIVMVGALAALSMLNSVGMIAGAAAIVIMSQALAAIAMALLMLKAMTMEEVATALLALGGAIGILVAAAYAVQPVILPLMALAVAFAAIGAAAALVGGAILAVATALGIVASITGQQADNIKAAIVAVAEGMRDSAAMIGEAVVNFIVSFVTNLAQGSADICEALAKMIVDMISTLAKRAPQIVHEGANLIVNFIKGITTEIPRIVDAAVKAVIAFIDALAKGIKDNYPAFKSAVKNLFQTIWDVITDMVSEFLDVGASIVSAIGDGIHDALDTLADLGSTIVNAITGNIDNKEFEKSGAASARSWNASFKKNINTSVQTGGKKKKSGSKTLALEEADALEESANAGGESFEAMSIAVSEMADVLDGIDSEPTIRPVMDLSDVESGAKRIDELVSADQAWKAQSSFYSPWIPSSLQNESSNQTVYNITLDYDAGTDANAMVRELTRAIQMSNRMEG